MLTMIVLLTRLAVLTVVATTLATAASLGARAGWLPELFSHFPVQYLCLQFMAAAACLALRLRPWALVALAAAVPNLLVVGPYLLGWTSAPATVLAGTGTAPVPVRLRVRPNMRWSISMGGAVARSPGKWRAALQRPPR
jgi:hypothetical protein